MELALDAAAELVAEDEALEALAADGAAAAASSSMEDESASSIASSYSKFPTDIQPVMSSNRWVFILKFIEKKGTLLKNVSPEA